MAAILVGHDGGSETYVASKVKTCNEIGFKSSLIRYEADVTEEELLRMNNLWRVKGYYGTREFYQPDELDVQSPLPDARNVLLWKPDIVTDEKGVAEVEFFCSDINTSFVGVVEGTDGLGNLGTSQCEFRVLKP